MQLLNQTQLNEDIGIIQLLHSRLGLDLAKCMAYGTGNFVYIKELNKKNILIGKYLEILNSITMYGDETLHNHYNVLTITEIESIIDDCYRRLVKYEA